MHSMTGYGRATCQADGRSVTIELKSVNHRFLDLNLRMPRAFMFFEDAMRKQIAGAISRGHLDVFVTYVNQRVDSKRVSADEGLARAYMRALDDMQRITGMPDDRSLSLLARLPDALVITEAEDDEQALAALAKDALEQALSGLNAMRAREGESLRAELIKHIGDIESMARSIEERYPQTVKEYQQKLRQRVEELLNSAIDEARLNQEIALMADRSDIAEEIARLTSHIAQARENCAKDSPVGRGLDFIVQEMNREVNTITSKSQDISITQAVIACKSAIEKLREQLQNVE